MKINWNKKYTTIAVYSFIVIAVSIIFYLVLSEIEQFSLVLATFVSIINPFIYGFVFAYLINFPLKLFIKYLPSLRFFKKTKESKIHIISLILAYILSGLLIYLFITLILPQLITSITGLIKNTPGYIRSTTDYIEAFSTDTLIPTEIRSFINDRWVEIAEYINKLATALIPTLLSFLRNIAQSFFNIFLGLIVSTYMLAEKDHFISISKKVNYSIFNKVTAEKLLAISRRSNIVFSDFLGGKILDCAIVGLIAFIVLSIVRMPYTLLVSFIVAVTNIIPFFGPFIGAIPSFLIIFFESPVMAVWFVVIILILQQLDGNVIGPKILGNSLGISSFWILFSVLISGKLFGFIGMVIGVPLFVLIYSIAKEIMEERLKSKDLPVETEEYRHK